MQQTFDQISNQVTEKWSALTKAQKIKIYIGLIAFLITIIAIGILTRPKMAVLYRNLDLQQAAEVTNVLSEKKIKHKVIDDGTTIQVEDKQLNDAKLILAKENIPKGKYNFDDAITNTMSTTQDEKRAKLNNLRKIEIESALESIDGVEDAQVTLVIPEEKNSFLQSKQQSTASVLLSLNTPLSNERIQGIARFVSNSVQNLDMKNINIIDSEGNNLYAGSEEGNLALNKQQELTRSTEESIKKKVSDLLNPIYDEVSIGPNLVFDFNQYEEVREAYTPQFEDNSRGIVKQESVSESSQKNTASGAQPGITANGAATGYQQTNGNNGESKSSTKDIVYVNDKTVSTTVKNPGRIDLKASSIAVHAYKYKVYTEKEITPTLSEETWQQFKEKNKEVKPITIDENLVASIKSATGIDNVVVQGYEKPVFQDKETYQIDYKDYLPFVLILVILVIGIIAVMKFRKHDEVVEVEPELEVEEMLKTTKEQIELEEIELKESLETKRQIDKFVDEKPEAVANLLRNWLTEEDWE